MGFTLRDTRQESVGFITELGVKPLVQDNRVRDLLSGV